MKFPGFLHEHDGFLVLIEQIADALNIEAHLIEKDYWLSKGDYRFDQTILNDCDEDEADEIRDAYSEKFSGYGSKLGGYPEFVQGDPRECYQCFPTIKLDRGGIWKMKMDEAAWKGEGSEFEFILLIQLDKGFMWGDCGIGNFFIRKADLLKRDFSRVLYDWSCY